MECLYLNGTLQPATALLARLLRRPCVVGKSILMSREALEFIGEFRPVRDYLAEDYLLGVEVHRAGYRVVLSAEVLDTTEISKAPRAAWARHRRWAMMRKRLAGPAYAAELLASPLLWFAGAVAFSGGRAGPIVAAAGLLAVRYLAEVAADRDAGHRFPARDVALMPLRDFASAILFWAGMFGRATQWRGRRMLVGPGTLILPADTAPAAGLLPPLSRAV